MAFWGHFFCKKNWAKFYLIFWSHGQSLGHVYLLSRLSCSQHYLEVYDHAKDDNGGHEVGQVGQVLSVEGFPEGAHLVLAGGQQVEERDDGALELGASAGVDGRRRERLPDDGLADVGGDEEGNSRPEAVALLEELVKLKIRGRFQFLKLNPK